MYPLITPGAIVQIDERRKRILSGRWHRESERPIYFLETRGGFACSWCALEDGNMILQPHPVSPERMRILPSGDVDVIGQVVAVAMRLDTLAQAAERSQKSFKWTLLPPRQSGTYNLGLTAFVIQPEPCHPIVCRPRWVPLQP
jgi:hypothetical protein